MSHNVELQGVKFMDLAILERAAKELISEGVIKGEFRTGDVPIRGWRGAAGENMNHLRPGQRYYEAENHVCPAGIVFTDQKYDIGFNRSPEGAFVPFLEHGWTPPVAAEGSAETVAGQSCRYNPQAALVGRLSQRYAVIMAERNAARQSLPTRRVHGKGGQIQLEVTHR